MIREVVLSPVEVPERRTGIKVYWESGAVTEMTTQRPTKLTRNILPNDVLETIRNEFNAGKTDSEIADLLNQRGHRTAQRRSWKVHSVRTIRLRDGLHRTKKR
jgi:hypothetical protein